MDIISCILSILLPQTTFAAGRDALVKSGLVVATAALVKEPDTQCKALDILKYWTLELEDNVSGNGRISSDLDGSVIIASLSEAFNNTQSAVKFEIAQVAVAWMSEVRT